MTFKALGAILRPYSRIGGVMFYPPPNIAHIQTDGSFRYREPTARIAVLLIKNDRETILTQVKNVGASTSAETEWASVAHGILFALENNECAISLENDNLGVIQDLISPMRPLKHDYANYYRHEIQYLAKQTLWTGIRWTPREANYADRLFYQKI